MTIQKEGRNTFFAATGEKVNDHSSQVIWVLMLSFSSLFVDFISIWRNPADGWPPALFAPHPGQSISRVKSKVLVSLWRGDWIWDEQLVGGWQENESAFQMEDKAWEESPYYAPSSQKLPYVHWPRARCGATLLISTLAICYVGPTSEHCCHSWPKNTELLFSFFEAGTQSWSNQTGISARQTRLL